MICIQSQSIDVSALIQSVGDENAGAVVLFVGTTRKLTAGRETVSLEYDCYEAMAISELEKLREGAMERWPLTGCAVIHRTGVVAIGEASVALAVSGPHRAAAYEASRWIMDQLKQKVPIWKKEQWTDGSTDWVHPESTGDDSASLPK